MIKPIPLRNTQLWEKWFQTHEQKPGRKHVQDKNTKEYIQEGEKKEYKKV